MNRASIASADKSPAHLFPTLISLREPPLESLALELISPLVHNLPPVVWGPITDYVRAIIIEGNDGHWQVGISELARRFDRTRRQMCDVARLAEKTGLVLENQLQAQAPRVRCVVRERLWDLVGASRPILGDVLALKHRTIGLSSRSFEDLRRITLAAEICKEEDGWCRLTTPDLARTVELSPHRCGRLARLAHDLRLVIADFEPESGGQKLVRRRINAVKVAELLALQRDGWKAPATNYFRKMPERWRGIDIAAQPRLPVKRRLRLQGEDEPPIIDDRVQKLRLRTTQYNVLQAVLESSAETGLSKDDLVAKSGQSDAVNIFKRLASKSPLDQVLVLPVKAGNGYRAL